MIDLSKGRVLVTGGAGFIGSALIWQLNRLGCDNILVADFLGSDEKWKNLVPLRFADYVEADELLASLTRDASRLGEWGTIFHFGACSSTTELDASFLIRRNYESTKALAHFAVERGIRFVYASSAATYGNCSGALPESEPLINLRPLNMYGYSKHLFDSYAERVGILPRITGLKFFNVYGPNEWHKGGMRSVVIKAFEQIGSTGRMQLFKSYKPEFTDGMQVRDFLYVKDAVAAAVFLAERVNGGGLFNLGSGQPNTWLSLAHAIFAALSKTPQVEFVDMPEGLRSRYQYFTCADIRKLREAGFNQPMTSLDAGVADYVRQYLIPRIHLGDECSSVSGRGETA